MRNCLLLPAICLLLCTGCASRVANAPFQAPAINQPPAVTSNFVAPNKITAPRPLVGNHGKYMSPYTADGAIAPWAQENSTGTDNGSEVAASVGSAVGQQVANRALSFVPFGLGGVIGRGVGESVARASTRKKSEPELPSLDAVKAGSDVSFDTVDQLAVHLYSKFAAHADYARVLALTKTVYPELEQAYIPAIEKASLASKRSGHPEFAPPGKISAPRPVSGKLGKYVSPFTRKGTVALWAQVQPSESDNPSQLPEMEAVRASSNVSFNSVDDLAVHMYAKNSSHKEYERVLNLTKMLYPELEQAYVPAIEKASLAAKKKTKKKKG